MVGTASLWIVILAQYLAFQCEYGYLEVSITGNEIEPVNIDNISDIWSEAEETYAPYGIVSITSTCPSFDPAVADLSILE